MLFKPLDIDHIKIFISSFCAVTEQFLGVVPGPRSVTKVKELGSKNSMFVKASFSDGLVGNCFIGMSEYTACAVAARIHERLWKEKTTFNKISPEVNELLVEFASHLLNNTVESFRDHAVNCSVTSPNVVGSQEGQAGEHEYAMAPFPLGEMGNMELYLGLKVGVSQENTGKRIMIVDDSPTMREMLRRILEEAGYTIVGEAANGREAVNRVAGLSPDLVTMDIEMPEIDGIQALSAIRISQPRVKVIMVSSLADRSKVLECISKGAVNYILKPYEASKVVDVVAKAIL